MSNEAQQHSEGDGRDKSRFAGTICSVCGRAMRPQQVFVHLNLVVQTEDEQCNGVKPLLDADNHHPQFTACSSRCYGVLQAYVAVRVGER